MKKLQINYILTFRIKSWCLTHPFLLFFFALVSCSEPVRKSASIALEEIESDLFTAPDTASIPHNETGKMIRYGLALIQNTNYYIGPEGVVSKNLRNKMNCTSCHLKNGTKAYGLNFFTTHSSYPQFRGRENAVLSLADRVNNCIERPHNGVPLAIESKEMLAIMTYIKWVGESFDSEKHEGQGLKPIEFEGLSADPARGELVYIKNCESCHQHSGEGLLNNEKTGYTYPPLWGKNSYQESSSMHRVIKAASFIKYNMPNTVDWLKPILSDQEALDVAAFINDGTIHSRPKSRYISYPNKLYKPIDYFKGPYMDTLSEKTHAFGPWDEIIEYYKANNLSVYF